MTSIKSAFGWMAVALLAACGGGGAGVSAGPMPPEGSFTGVYFSPQYGEMHMIQNGSSVIGEYKKDERSGKIQGDADGNLMRFEWTENRAMVSNRPTVTRGRGYFRYSINPTNNEHQIDGEWGLDENETGGGPWTAVKSKRRQPRLSTDSESSGGDSGGSDLDEEESSDDSSESEEDLF